MSLPTSSDNRGSRAFKTSSNSHCGSCSSRLGLRPNSLRRSAIRSQIRFDAAVIARLLSGFIGLPAEKFQVAKQRERPRGEPQGQSHVRAERSFTSPRGGEGGTDKRIDFLARDPVGRGSPSI